MTEQIFMMLLWIVANFFGFDAALAFFRWFVSWYFNA